MVMYVMIEKGDNIMRGSTEMGKGKLIAEKNSNRREEVMEL